MKLLINAHYLNRKVSGLARYARQITGVLNYGRDVILLPNNSDYSKFMRTKLLRYMYLIFLENIAVVFLKFFRRPCVHISPAFSAPFVDMRGTSAVVVHDLAFNEEPRYYLFREKLFFKINMFFLKLSSSAIVVPSIFVGQSIVNTYNIDSSRIQVISPYSEFGLADTDQSAEKQRYFLLVSNNHPRKNLQNTIDGFLKSAAPKQGHKLLVVGNFEVAPRYDSDLVMIKEGVSDLELKTLYKNASAALLFSFSEGYGYPVVEAASLGTPSITSEVTSLAEFVFGRAPEKAHTVEEIEQKITKFILCPDYAEQLLGDVQIINERYSREKFANKWHLLIKQLNDNVR